MMIQHRHMGATALAWPTCDTFAASGQNNGEGLVGCTNGRM